MTLASIVCAFLGAIAVLLIGGLAISAVRQRRVDREWREYLRGVSYTGHDNAGAA